MIKNHTDFLFVLSLFACVSSIAAFASSYFVSVCVCVFVIAFHPPVRLLTKGKEGNREKCPVKWKRISPLGCVWRFAWTPSCFFLRGVVTATWKIYAFCLLEEQISPSRSLSSCGVVFWVRFASDDKCKTEIASLLFVFVLLVCYFAYFFFCFVLFIRRGHLSRGTWTFLFLFCLLFVTTKKHLFFFSLFTLKTELAQHCQLLIFVLDFLSVSAGSGNRIGRGAGFAWEGMSAIFLSYFLHNC